MPSITAKDGAGANLVLGSTTDASGNVVLLHAPMVAGAAIAATNPLPMVARPHGSVTQTVITVTAATSVQLVAANSARRYLALAVIGTSPANLGFAGSAAANSGWPLDGASETGRQGGGIVWEGSTVPSGAVHAYSTVGTTIVVLEG